MLTQHDDARPARLRSLDGLRGLAALVVVVHHCLLTSDAFFLPQIGLTGGGGGAWAWWLLHSPVRLVWAGAEAVLVFFVLSGFVLQVLVSRASFSWVSYYPSRMARLYLPAWAAVVLALLVGEFLVGALPAASSQWLRQHSGDPAASQLPGQLLLLVDLGGVNGPLWSIRWEVVYSLALPLTALGVVAARRRPLLAAVALLGVAMVGAVTGWSALLYLPVFCLGALMASHHERLRGVARSAERYPLAWPACAVAAVLLLTGRWLLDPWLDGPVSSALVGAQVAGAALVVLLFVHWPAARSVGEVPVLQWLGTVSFSLYLVHEPVLVVIASALGERWSVPLLLVLAVPASLVTAAVFHRLVEAPSHRFAQWLGRRSGAPLRPGSVDLTRA